MTLQARDLGLEEAKVHQARTEVLSLDVLDARAVDREDGDGPAVDAADQDLAQLAAAHEAESPEEKIVGLEHVSPPWKGEPDLGYGGNDRW